MLMSKKPYKICVIRGGPGQEYDLSLDTGSYVKMQLEDTEAPEDILIDREGRWIRNGKGVRPEQALWDIDVAFNALHGEYGEGGEVQKIFEAHHVPYTGSEAFSCQMSLNKHAAKKFFKAHGIKTPFSRVVEKNDTPANIAMNLFYSMPLPMIIKPLSGMASHGVEVVFDFPELEAALTRAFRWSDKLLLEEYIQGTVVSCGVIEHFRDQELYALIPVEIPLPKGEAFLDYERRNELTYNVPASITLEEKKKVQEFSLLAHVALGLRHYSQSDFIISPKRGVYLLETNALPHLGNKSIFMTGLEAVGSNADEFVDHIVGLALEN